MSGRNAYAIRLLNETLPGTRVGNRPRFQHTWLCHGLAWSQVEGSAARIASDGEVARQPAVSSQVIQQWSGISSAVPVSAMSTWGYERPICDGSAMSASHPRATKSLRRAKWRNGPLTTKLRCSNLVRLRRVRRLVRSACRFRCGAPQNRLAWSEASQHRPPAPSV